MSNVQRGKPCLREGDRLSLGSCYWNLVSLAMAYFRRGSLWGLPAYWMEAAGSQQQLKGAQHFLIWGFQQCLCRLPMASLHLSPRTQLPLPWCLWKGSILLLPVGFRVYQFDLPHSSYKLIPSLQSPGGPARLVCDPTAAHPSSGQRTSDFSSWSPEALFPAPPPVQESCFLCLPDVMGELCG